MIIRWVIAVSILLLIEIYAFQAIKTVVKVRWIAYSYEVISLIAIGVVIYGIMHFDRSVGQTKQTLFTAAVLLVTLLPKIIMTLVLFGEDLFRLPVTIVNFFSKPADTKFLEYIPERRKFVSQIALGLAAIPFLSLLYGIFKGKYDYRVIKQTIVFDDLPDAFDGFTITQISDVHSGSFDNPEKINYAIDLINAQDSDMILFTGDIVNTFATEMHPWVDDFNRIKTPAFGKYSVLGNHDYGEYVQWDSATKKAANFEAIKDLYRQIGFKLMLNEHTFIRKGDDKIALVGVENWGQNFKKAGDLNKAASGLGTDDFKILMSHDPSHWEYEIKNHPKNFHVTLAGHTHGFQFGIEIPGVIKWSPAQYFYKQWAGLYENAGRYVYVNRGFGFHAYPGRVGMPPEITVIELKKASKVA
jgi:predicted MPP superfamily phosphohydrolase